MSPRFQNFVRLVLPWSCHQQQRIIKVLLLWLEAYWKLFNLCHFNVFIGVHIRTKYRILINWFRAIGKYLSTPFSSLQCKHDKVLSRVERWFHRSLNKVIQLLATCFGFSSEKAAPSLFLLMNEWISVASCHFFNMGQPRPLFGIIHCWAFSAVITTNGWQSSGVSAPCWWGMFLLLGLTQQWEVSVHHATWLFSRLEWITTVPSNCWTYNPTLPGPAPICLSKSDATAFLPNKDSFKFAFLPQKSNN